MAEAIHSVSSGNFFFSAGLFAALVCDHAHQIGERDGSNLARGFTGHEMLDDVGLIHMNGRLYDPALGRMCAADPYVQTPENVQNYNRYSYALNNPLSQIDPSGHIIIGLIVALATAVISAVGAVIATVAAFVSLLAALAAQFVITVVGVLNGAAAAMGSLGSSLMAAAKAGLTAVSGFVTGGGAAAGAAGGAAAGGAAAAGGGLTVGKVLLGAAIGAAYNGIQTAINGGGLSDILKAAAMGAVTGAVGAVVGGGLHGLGDAVGSFLSNATEKTLSGTVVHLAAHGVAGGAMSEAMGGSFKDGFIGGLIGAGVGAVTGQIPGLEGDGPWKIIGRTAVAGISGGVASALSGGKFADGAFSAAFFHLFNNEAGNASATRRKLTKGETALAKSVFGDALKLENIEIRYENFLPMQDSGTFMTPDGNIYVPKDYRWIRDFSSRLLPLDIKGTFIHELVHVYQRAVGINVPLRGLVSWARPYDYTWKNGKGFFSYGMEQQARIVQDYFLKVNGVTSVKMYRGDEYRTLRTIKEYESIIPWKKN